MPSRQALGVVFFAVIALVAGHWLGGGAALGRADAALLIPTLLPAALVFRALPDRWRPASMVLLPTAALVLLAITAAALMTSSMADHWRQLVSLAAASLAALALVRALWAWTGQWRGLGRVALAAALAILWWLGTHVALGAAYSAAPARQPGKILVLTGLPLRAWQDPDKMLALPQEDAALVALRARTAREIIFADGLATGSVGPEDRLLLVHPLALPPETLVEIDRAIRAGGRAIILADGLSAWPPPFALGDRRNPPVTSLLTPLLDRWGIDLAAPVPGSVTAEEMEVRTGSYQLRLHSAGHFERLPRACRAEAAQVPGHAMIATCRIGRGEAVVLSDADLLFAPLWQSEPAWARHLRPSDNIEWVADLLNR